jgi:putative solute:sodium symporter small subunit
MTERHPPRRVRVVLADRRPGEPQTRPPVRRGTEVAEQTEIGRELVRGLVRAQLAVSLRIAGIALVVFGPLPALFALVPALQDLRVFGVPLAWWVLGLAAYPVLYLLARLHRRQAERIEREFSELLGRG